MAKKKSKKGGSGSATEYVASVEDESGERVKNIWEYDSDEEVAAGIIRDDAIAIAAKEASEKAEAERQAAEEKAKLAKERKVAKRLADEQKALQEKDALRQRIRHELASRPSAAQIEAEKIEDLLAANNLELFMIQPDGNCLYSAVAHQLYGDASRFSEMRKICAKAMRDFASDFRPFLEGVSTDADFYKYVSDIEQTAEWGGYVELLALSRVLGFRAEVFNGDSVKPLVVGEDSSESKAKRIRLAFHRHFYALGEHYNSVVEIDSRSQEHVQDVAES
jgi:OTU domain-containing protein 6